MMTNEEFETFLAQADAALEKKQQHLKSHYGLSNLNRWKLDDNAGSLQFFNEAGKLQVTADTIPIGRYQKREHRWCWSWCDTQFSPPLRQRAGELKNLKQVTGFELFNKKAPFVIDPEMPWELAAVAVWQLDAMGCYRAAMGENELLFVAITDIARVS